MKSRQRQRLGKSTEELALMAAAALEEQLADPEGDVKRARDLAAILKDMVGLACQLEGEGSSAVTVRFLDAAEDAAR